jgi:hypothetical protein
VSARLTVHLDSADPDDVPAHEATYRDLGHALAGLQGVLGALYRGGVVGTEGKSRDGTFRYGVLVNQHAMRVGRWTIEVTDD